MMALWARSLGVASLKEGGLEENRCSWACWTLRIGGVEKVHYSHSGTEAEAETGVEVGQAVAGMG
jgi:hypothetical protein